MIQWYVSCPSRAQIPGPAHLKLVNQQITFNSGSFSGQCSIARVLFAIFTPILGTEYYDTVTIAPNVAINQSIGVSLSSSDSNPYDGILG
jgi:hypothetical protein